MCDLISWQGREPIDLEPSLQLIQRAFPSPKTLRWQVAWYPGGPSPRAANMVTLADRWPGAAGLEGTSRAMLAHAHRTDLVRASRPDSSLYSYGHWTFAVNASIPARHQVTAHLIQETSRRLRALRQGSSGGEHFFLWLLSRMARAGCDPERPCSGLDRLVDVAATSVRYATTLAGFLDASSPMTLSFLLSDGEVLVAARWNQALHWLQHDGGATGRRSDRPRTEPSADAGARAVIVATRPFSAAHWHEVPDAHVLSVDRDLDVRIKPIDSAAPAEPIAW